MNYHEAVHRLPEMTAFDLNDYGDDRLSDQGELEVYPDFKHDIIIKLGGDILELSKIPFPGENRAHSLPTPARNAYILKNLHPDADSASILIDDRIDPIGEIPAGPSGLIVYGRSSVIVGRSASATPELALSDTASREHMSLRLGNMQGRVHFADLGSSNGTTVYLHPKDDHFISTPRRIVVFERQEGAAPDEPPVVRLKTEAEERWLR